MKQIEATEIRPFYSVAYQYTHTPYTLHSCNRFGTGKDGQATMQGTSNLALAKRIADKLITEPGICYAQVSMSVDCYNHSQVYKVWKQS
jgi:hypothetical protein